MSRLIATPIAIVLFATCGGCSSGETTFPDGGPSDAGQPPLTNPLPSVKRWALQLSGLDRPEAVEQLAASAYDMVVIDPIATDAVLQNRDMAEMVRQLQLTQGSWGQRKLVLAYLSIGTAEARRTYWKPDWVAPAGVTPGNPDFLLAPDPAGRPDRYAVAFWDIRWRRVLTDGPASQVERIMAAGFDGLYVDGISSYLALRNQARDAQVDAADRMLKLVAEIRALGQKLRGGFVLVANGGISLSAAQPSYPTQLDGVAYEQVYFTGDPAASWADAAACDGLVPEAGAEGRQALEAQLEAFHAGGLPVFNVEYACSQTNVDGAYARSAQHGFVPYVSRQPLDRLSATPPPAM